MKRILAIAVAAMASVMALAQSSVGAGYLDSRKSSGSESSSQNGFYAGVNTTVGDLGPLKVTPGVYLEYVTSSESVNLFGLAGGTGKSTEVYLDIPVHFSMGVDLDGARLFAFAGPTLSLGCYSKVETSGSVLGKSTGTQTVDQYGDGTNYSRLDIMFGVGAGLDISMFRFTLGYDYGLVDRNSSDHYELHRSKLHFGVSYLF